MDATRLLLTPLVVIALLAFWLTGNYRGASDAPAAAVASATAEALPIAASAPRPSRLFFAQVIGLSGCDQPLYVIAGGLRPMTPMHLRRDDTSARRLHAGTSAEGLFREVGTDLLAPDCEPGRAYSFSLLELDTSHLGAAGSYMVPRLSARIEVDPPAGGCRERPVTVTLRGLPPGARVMLFSQEALPGERANGALGTSPLVVDMRGEATAGPLTPSWPCTEAARSLFVVAGANGPDQRLGELLYRVALGPGEPLPGLD